jgi:hypothetical protein
MPSSVSWNTPSKSIAWELQCASFQGEKKVVKNLNGCIHYDAKQPAIMWE